MIKISIQIILALVLLALLALIYLQFGGYMQNRWSSLSNQANHLDGEIFSLDQAANNIFNKRYPLDLSKTNYHKLKTQYAEVKEKKENHRKLWQVVKKLDDPAVYVILPYAIFSLTFIISVGGSREREITPSNYGRVLACLVCVVIFYYLVVYPVKCVDLACIIPLGTIPLLTLVLASAVAFTTSAILSRDQDDG